MTASADNSNLMEASLVVVVDDDESIRAALNSLFRSVGLKAQCYGSVQDFSAGHETLPDCPTCLVLDVRLPGVSGLDLQAQLVRSEFAIPIIFMTAHGDIPMSVRAMRAGAVDFLAKPFRDQDMLDAVAQALQRDRLRRDEDRRIADSRRLYDTLTAREKEVMALVADGFLNKQIAAQLNLSEITIKIHRARLMKKIRATCLADLVKMSKSLDIRH
jgi:FixJ family two-component response regulator